MSHLRRCATELANVFSAHKLCSHKKMIKVLPSRRAEKPPLRTTKKEMMRLLSEADYKCILSQVIRKNPFISGNNCGFGLNTPSVPPHLSLVLNRKKKRKKRKAEHDICVTGSCTVEQCIRKKIKSAYEKNIVIDLSSA